MGAYVCAAYDAQLPFSLSFSQVGCGSINKVSESAPVAGLDDVLEWVAFVPAFVGSHSYGQIVRAFSRGPSQVKFAFSQGPWTQIPIPTRAADS